MERLWLFWRFLLFFVPIEQSQAQLIINVYPSQDNPTNQTLWIFSGTGTARELYSVRNSSSGNANRHRRDTWEVDDNGGDLYVDPEPSSLHIALSPLLSSSNAKDIASLNARIPGGGKTNITFAASATNTPTITIAGRGSRTIARRFMSENAYENRDGLGIRIQSPNLVFGDNEASSWVGAGLIDKPIGDFFAGTFNDYGDGGGSRHFARNNNAVRLVINSQIIPEPQEYALIFGLFALGFVLFRRHWQKKRRQQAATTL